MTVAAFLALTPAEQDAEVARWLGWPKGTISVPVYWRHAGSGEMLCSSPAFVSGGWEGFGEMLDAVPGDIVMKRIGSAWVIGLSHWWDDSGTPLPAKDSNPNLALALALGKALGTLTEK